MGPSYLDRAGTFSCVPRAPGLVFSTVYLRRSLAPSRCSPRIVELFEYQDAATAYDQAFSIYNSLGKDDVQRPYRMMWYQTGPYKAYFYSGRYQDVIALANITLTETISKPTIEESLYWRGRAYYMLGDTKSAVDDFREALRLHPNWGPAVQALQDLGLQP